MLRRSFLLPCVIQPLPTDHGYKLLWEALVEYNYQSTKFAESFQAFFAKPLPRRQDLQVHLLDVFKTFKDHGHLPSLDYAKAFDVRPKVTRKTLIVLNGPGHWRTSSPQSGIGLQHKWWVLGGTCLSLKHFLKSSNVLQRQGSTHRLRCFGPQVRAMGRSKMTPKASSEATMAPPSVGDVATWHFLIFFGARFVFTVSFR